MKTVIYTVAIAIVITACASQPPEPPAPLPPLESRLDAQNRAAMAAFEKGRFQQAADLYDQALLTATAMDDSLSIVDALYNRAASLLLAENYPEAKRSVRRAEDESVRAGRNSPPELTLLAATLAYRTGEDASAWELTQALVGPDAAVGAQIRDRAWFLRGLLAKRRQDEQALNDAIAALGASRDPDTRPDRLELQAYRDTRLDPAAAVNALDAASRYRNETGDYRGMSRSLVAAAEVLESADQLEEAADRFLRAGRSAASRGSVGNARRWLQRAERLATEAGTAAIAEEARTQLQQLGERS